ncbi:unnamed protein product [Adineta ricciae]|uniref:RanBP2-type domain-containing protein n=1 Tax=Adineta ricciae TaxID=249248 RepID=A0A814U018_ADIRI|nr:unnamed protein product [Adineta ricciae]
MSASTDSRNQSACALELATSHARRCLLNKHNESMMHKVKDVVTKFLNPSFLFSPNNETDSAKRKRSDSPKNEVANEQEIDRTPRHDHTNERRIDSHSDESQLTDDEDNNNRDVPSTEQQTKRRRTSNYQHVTTTTTSHHHGNERTSPGTKSVISSTHTTPILCRTSIEQDYSEVVHRVRHHYNHPSSYRRTTSNYDPSKSPLFSAGNRAMTTSQSNETAANHLLATSLTNRSSPFVSANSQSSHTLTNPVLKQRQMYGSGYSAINPRRLSYIERLRRRTLQDCVRFDRALADEPLATTTEKPQSTTTDPSIGSHRLKVLEKECGVQCDITVEGPNKTTARTFPPEDIRDEALLIPNTDKIQTDSSITIEKSQPPKPTFTITKPKVLGNITPFSWPKFARAQDEYAKKYPDKCRHDAVVPSIIGKSNASISSTNQSQTTDSPTTSKNIFSVKSPSRPAESIWKCPCCTKEHPAQTASCSLCHGINPNYKKPSANQLSVSVGKEQLLTTIASSAPLTVTKESTTFTLAPSISSQTTTTTKESVVPTASSTVTTNSISITFPTFGTVQNASILPATTKENTVTTTASSSIPLFGVSPIMSQQKNVTTSATIPTFGVTPSFAVTNSTASSTLTNTFPPIFGVTTTTITTASTVPATTVPATTVPATTVPSFGITTTKDTLINSSRLFQFGTSSSLSSSDSSMITSPSSSFPVTSAFQPFASTSSSHLTTPATTSSSTVSIPFGSFGSSTLPTTTTAATFTPFTPIVTPLTTTAFSSGATAATTTSTSTTSNIFGTSLVSSSSTATNLAPFPGLSAINALPSALTGTTSSTPAFGIGNFSFTSSSSSSANPPFGSLGSTAVRPFAPLSISSTSTNNPPTFGSIAPFGASAMSAERPANPIPQFSFGTPSTNSSSSSSVGGFAFGAQSSAPPLFGATSQPIFPPTAINFGVPPSTSTTSNLFDMPPSLSGSIDSAPTLFTIGSGSSTSNSPRRVLRARRTDRS